MNDKEMKQMIKRIRDLADEYLKENFWRVNDICMHDLPSDLYSLKEQKENEQM